MRYTDPIFHDLARLEFAVPHVAMEIRSAEEDACLACVTLDKLAERLLFRQDTSESRGREEDEPVYMGLQERAWFRKCANRVLAAGYYLQLHVGPLPEMTMMCKGTLSRADLVASKEAARQMQMEL